MSESVRDLQRPRSFATVGEVREFVREIVRVDRMAGQPTAICVCVEKAAMESFLVDWFWDYGVWVTSLVGFSSQTLVNKILRWYHEDGRPLRVLYAGDHDPSGEDIDRDLRNRLCGDGLDIEVMRIGLLPEHVDRFELLRNEFEKEDSRIKAFEQRHGGVWQTELDALDPDDLRQLFEAEFFELWDLSVYEERLADDALIDKVFNR